MTNYYQVLGVSATATKEQVKLAYLKLSKKVHPDVNNGDTYFDELFKSINEAYTCLSDDARRQQYDARILHQHKTSYIKEPKHRPAEQQVWVQPHLKRTIFLRAGISVLLGLLVVILFSVAFDNEATVTPSEAKVRELVEQTTNNIPAPKPSINMAAIYRQQISRPESVHAESVRPETAFAVNTIAVDALKTEPATVENKLIDENEMGDFLRMIEQENTTGKPVKTIRLLQTSTSNITNAFDFAHYLQAKGYFIAGREKIERQFDGVRVEKQTGCIIFVFGRL